MAPNPTDEHVGSRMRLRRVMLGMSQQDLGATLGVTVQLVQDYESGAEHIGASRLMDVAQVLQVAVTFFFDDNEPAVH